MAVPVTIERLQLPDVRRPERMPSLPAWVTSRVASLKIEMQPDPQTRKWRNAPTLPANLILGQAQRDEIARHVADLYALCGPVPADDANVEIETLAIVTKLMMVLPSAKQNDLSAEARGEAFMDALDDLPPWAVKAAVRRWHRNECGNNAQGEPYDCHWCPAPADLRTLALVELWRIKARAEVLDKIAQAEPLIDYSDEHCKAMRGKLGSLFRTLGSSSPLVGKDGSGGADGEGRSIAFTVGPDRDATRP